MQEIKRKQKGGKPVATSSITKSFIITGEKEAAALANAIEESVNSVKPEPVVSVRFLEDTAEIAAFLKKWDE